MGMPVSGCTIWKRFATFERLGFGERQELLDFTHLEAQRYRPFHAGEDHLIVKLVDHSLQTHPLKVVSVNKTYPARLDPNKSHTCDLSFLNPTNKAITYTYKVLRDTSV